LLESTPAPYSSFEVFGLGEEKGPNKRWESSSCTRGIAKAKRVIIGTSGAETLSPTYS